MYSLDCSYFHKKFDTLQGLLDHVMGSGMDPNYEITCDGVGMGEECIDHLIF